MKMSIASFGLCDTFNRIVIFENPILFTCSLPTAMLQLCGIELILQLYTLLELFQDSALPSENVTHVRFPVLVRLAPWWR